MIAETLNFKTGTKKIKLFKEPTRFNQQILYYYSAGSGVSGYYPVVQIVVFIKPYQCQNLFPKKQKKFCKLNQ